MITVLLIILAVLDVALLGVVFMLSQRRSNATANHITEITEERHILTELRETVREELEAAHAKAAQVLAKSTKLAAEVESEVRTATAAIRQELENAAHEIAGRFAEPLAELEMRQNSLTKLYKQLDRQKDVLSRMLSKGEQITKFFDDKVPYQEVLAEIEEKKYDDARALLARGLDIAQVSSQLGMSPLEVRLLNASLAR